LIANGRSNIEERLARWLLIAHDRVDGIVEAAQVLCDMRRRVL